MEKNEIIKRAMRYLAETEETNYKIAKTDYFSDRQHEVNKLLEIRSDCTFNSWKHTGVVELYNLFS